MLVLSSFAARVVAPTKFELEAMYTAAANEVNAGHYREALKKIDAIDARQPDLAAAHNLRGVAWMRLREYDRAETALRKARDLDPTFWEARFNLAEVPFLAENWTESRRRFTELYEGNDEQLRGITSDLIEFKILLTYILEDREKLGVKLLEKFQAADSSPAFSFAKAALAFRHKNRSEAESWMAKAEEKFSADLNGLFRESFYEVGWLKKPEGATPVALEVESTADRAARAQEDVGKAERAYREGDLEGAWQLLDQVDAVAPKQAVTSNLRGQILLEQGKVDEAEAAFREALTADPEFAQARYNRARIPFARKDYDTARKELEALLGATAGGRKERERQQLIRYQIYLTLLLQGRDGAAQKALDDFRMMDGSPALYYGQAAWAFQHGNPKLAANWMANAKNLFSSELNSTFAAPLGELGWVESAPAPPLLAVKNVTPKREPAPSPTPTPSPASPTPEATVTPPPVAQTPETKPAQSAEQTPEAEASPTEVPRAESKRSEANPTPSKKRSARKKPTRDDDRDSRRPKRVATGRDASPTPAPVAPPPPAQEAPRRQNLGDKVARFFLYPFKRKNEPNPTPRPDSAGASSSQPSASPTAGRHPKN
ncbi:MAG: tetratricopeptide repeat protein [Verrucomicrobiota bacterium]|nr:tetratricopeptide repeat protein [Verrucomicrobiota bacterium]